MKTEFMSFYRAILTIIFISEVSSISLNAEDYIISFAASGESSTISSVIAENLTRAEMKTINGTDILRLTAINTGMEEPDLKENEIIRFSPNPMKEYCRMEFELPAEGRTTVSLFDISGRELLREENNLVRGRHIYRIGGLDRGVYIVSVKSGGFSVSGRLISEGFNKGAGWIIHETLTEVLQKDSDSKRSAAEVVMQYTPGDVFKFTAISGNYSTVLSTIPSGSTSLTFNFAKCTDGDGNNYSTINIGPQVWMAENLKTTKFNDGAAIPNVIDNFSWMILETPSYSWFNHDINNKNIYGGLYNWYTVNTGKLCPAGWHVPSDTEWTTLINYLGGFALAADKMKERGNIHWKTENNDATNESGFTVLPAGEREYDGVFLNTLGYATYFWSSVASGTYNAWHIALFTHGPVTTNWVIRTFGFSVRCLKN